eukprot:scaffold232040_cov17-Tisochrysis_lutea.AAC.1
MRSGVTYRIGGSWATVITWVPLRVVRSWSPQMLQLRRCFVVKAINVKREWEGLCEGKEIIHDFEVIKIQAFRQYKISGFNKNSNAFQIAVSEIVSSTIHARLNYKL